MLNRLRFVALLMYVLLALSILQGSGLAAQTHENYALVNLWPKASQYFTMPQDMAVDADGNVYVIEAGRSRLQKFSSSGSLIRSWEGGGSSPRAIGIDSGNQVYVAQTNGFVSRFSTAGGLLGTTNLKSLSQNSLGSVQSMSVDKRGSLYVLDSSHKIHRFAPRGAYIGRWGSSGELPGQLGDAKDIAVDATGDVYTVECTSRRVQKFSPGGVMKKSFVATSLPCPESIAVSPSGLIFLGNEELIQKYTSGGLLKSEFGFNELYKVSNLVFDNSGNVIAASSYTDHLDSYSQSGKLLWEWGPPGPGSKSKFAYPEGVGVDRQGNIFVADTYNHRIKKFSPAGRFLMQWGTSGDAAGQFSYPQALALDSLGYVYVADTWNHRVQKFNSSGGFVASWGTADDILAPMGITVNKNGYVFVSDAGNSLIHKFNQGMTHLLSWGGLGIANGKFLVPVGLATDKTGDVFVADAVNGNIQSFTANGSFKQAWFHFPDHPSGDLEIPTGVAVDRSGNIYVSDMGHDKILVFSRGASLLKVYGSGNLFTDPSEYFYPENIVFGPFGELVVVDSGNHRIKKLGITTRLSLYSSVTSVSAGKPVTIKGRLITNGRRAPISGANVRLRGKTSDGTVKWTAMVVTNSQGYYSRTLKPARSLRYSAAFSNYRGWAGTTSKPVAVAVK